MLWKLKRKCKMHANEWLAAEWYRHRAYSKVKWWYRVLLNTCIDDLDAQTLGNQTSSLIEAAWPYFTQMMIIPAEPTKEADTNGWKPVPVKMPLFTPTDCEEEQEGHLAYQDWAGYAYGHHHHEMHPVMQMTMAFDSAFGLIQFFLFPRYCQTTPQQANLTVRPPRPKHQTFGKGTESITLMNWSIKDIANLISLSRCPGSRSCPGLGAHNLILPHNRDSINVIYIFNGINYIHRFSYV